ncbi:MAG TPA: DUF4870 domain-containing protein [Pseudogracilibacillus sp.]|nr:DUF4870 domain-containing protein [Pseudogracilibacillus sp.]
MQEKDNIEIYNDDGSMFYNEPTSDDKLFATALYLLNFFTAILGPLIIWLLKRDTSAFIDYHGKEYFNLIITFFLYELAAIILMLVGIGFILVPIVSITLLIFIIVGAIKAIQGEYYKFPLIIRFIK